MKKEVFKKIRKAGKLSQEKFGLILGIKQNTVSDYERGEKPIPKPIEIIAEQLEAFGPTSAFSSPESNNRAEEDKMKEAKKWASEILDSQSDLSKILLDIISSIHHTYLNRTTEQPLNPRKGGAGGSQ